MALIGKVTCGRAAPEYMATLGQMAPRAEVRLLASWALDAIGPGSLDLRSGESFHVFDGIRWSTSPFGVFASSCAHVGQVSSAARVAERVSAIRTNDALIEVDEDAFAFFLGKAHASASNSWQAELDCSIFPCNNFVESAAATTQVKIKATVVRIKWHFDTRSAAHASESHSRVHGLETTASGHMGRSVAVSANSFVCEAT